jgi:YD repeat-containing protein
MGNLMVTSSSGMGQMTYYAYDCRAWCRGDLVAKSITYTNGLPTSITDFNSKIETRSYDTMGRLLTRVEASGTTLARTTTYTWDATRWWLLTQVEPIKVNGVSYTRTTTWTYNAQGQPLTMTVSSTAPSSTSRVTSYAYNSSGLLDTATDPRGVVTKLTYLSSGDVSTITQAYGTSLARTTTSGPMARTPMATRSQCLIHEA